MKRPYPVKSYFILNSQGKYECTKCNHRYFASTDDTMKRHFSNHHREIWNEIKKPNPRQYRRIVAIDKEQEVTRNENQNKEIKSQEVLRNEEQEINREVMRNKGQFVAESGNQDVARQDIMNQEVMRRRFFARSNIMENEIESQEVLRNEIREIAKRCPNEEIEVLRNEIREIAKRCPNEEIEVLRNEIREIAKRCPNEEIEVLRNEDAICEVIKRSRNEIASQEVARKKSRNDVIITRNEDVTGDIVRFIRSIETDDNSVIDIDDHIRVTGRCTVNFNI